MSIRQVHTDPLWAPLVTRSQAEIRASVDQAMAAAATPDAVAARIEARLAEQPRNWIALDALREVSVDRAIALPPELTARFEALRADDHSFMAEAASCAVCMWNVTACSIPQALVCNAPITLSPIGDIAGVLRAGVAVATGGEVDDIDLALSVVGLTATAAVLVSGGSSAAIKAGAGVLRMAHGMGRLSSGLVRMTTDAVRTGIDWARLPSVRNVDDLPGIVRVDRFRGLMSVASDMNEVRAATDMTTAFHLLPLVDNAEDARHLAAASKALGKKVVGQSEMLGKRLFRATVRWSHAAWQVIASLGAFAVTIALLVAHGLQHLLLRPLRRKLRRQARG